MNKLLKIIYLKYVIGHCRHCCCFCKFKVNKCKEEMWNDIKDWSWSTFRAYRKIKKNIKINVEVGD